jgi:hypothetical protein
MSAAIYDVYILLLLIICETPTDMNSSMHIDHRAAEFRVIVCRLFVFLETEDLVDVTEVSCLTGYCFFPQTKKTMAFELLPFFMLVASHTIFIN